MIRWETGGCGLMILFCSSPCLRASAVNLVLGFSLRKMPTARFWH